MIEFGLRSERDYIIMFCCSDWTREPARQTETVAEPRLWFMFSAKYISSEKNHFNIFCYDLITFIFTQ